MILFSVNLVEVKIVSLLKIWDEGFFRNGGSTWLCVPHIWQNELVCRFPVSYMGALLLHPSQDIWSYSIWNLFQNNYYSQFSMQIFVLWMHFLSFSILYLYISLSFSLFLHHIVFTPKSLCPNLYLCPSELMCPFLTYTCSFSSNWHEIGRC